MRRHRRDLRPVSEINLTSLLDVSFVLLISFMLVAPSLKYGLELDLPAVAEGAPPLPADTPASVTVLVPRPAGKGQEFYIDDAAVTLAQLEDTLRLRREGAGGKLSVGVEADREVPYETFVQVIAAVRRAGIESVGLPIEAGAVSSPSVLPEASPVDPVPPRP